MVVRPLVFALLAACGSRVAGFTDAAIDSGYVPDACEGISCFQFDCSTKGLPPTSISGIVHAPNGTLPLYGVDVYVPRVDPGPLPDGAQCDRCDQGLLGGSFAQTKTDEAGRFVLEDVPATINVPLVIQTGKWRRQLTLANVAACEDQPLPPVDTRLPKDSSEGDLPRIALSTGGADALECLLVKLGIAPKEFSRPVGTGRIHLFTNPVGALDTGGNPAGQGASQFQAGWPGGTGAFGASQTLWSDANNMKPYDIVMLSCEGSTYPGSKPTPSMNALKAYADLGGRVFLSHWHNVWVEGSSTSVAPAEWRSIATWSHGPDLPNPTTDLIDEVANPKGPSFATWMLNVGGSTVRGVVPVQQAQQTMSGVDPAKAERWVYWKNPTTNVEYPQNFQFTTPNEVTVENRCGKVVYSDMHVSGNSSSDPAVAFPGGCSNAPLTQQEKALAFMFFDIASCVGVLF